MRRKTKKRVKRGVKMHSGKGWRLVKKNSNGQPTFVATLLGTFNLGDKRIAVFSVPKKSD